MSSGSITRTLVSTCVALASMLALAVRAQEAPGDVRGYLGPAFNATAEAPTLLNRPLRRFTSAADTLRFWNQVAIPGGGQGSPDGHQFQSTRCRSS